MRLGTRVATFPAEGTTVEQLVGAMTGALDFSTNAGTGASGKESAA
jgi:simple sugar transport system ATP-binding protein